MSADSWQHYMCIVNLLLNRINANTPNLLKKKKKCATYKAF